MMPMPTREPSARPTISRYRYRGQKIPAPAETLTPRPGPTQPVECSGGLDQQGGRMVCWDGLSRHRQSGVVDVHRLRYESTTGIIQHQDGRRRGTVSA